MWILPLEILNPHVFCSRSFFGEKTTERQLWDFYHTFRAPARSAAAYPTPQPSTNPYSRKKLLKPLLTECERQSTIPDLSTSPTSSSPYFPRDQIPSHSRPPFPRNTYSTYSGRNFTVIGSGARYICNGCSRPTHFPPGGSSNHDLVGNCGSSQLYHIRYSGMGSANLIYDG